MRRHIEAPHEGGMQPFAHLPSWPDDRYEITRQIKRRPGYFKIILKIRDELHFLTEWLDHHADIVGHDNIIIFDNKSSDSLLNEFYKSLPRDIIIARYNTLHNYIHNTNKFPELYEALSVSCSYFCFLDCDEYLAYVDDDCAVHRREIVDVIRDGPKYGVIPTVWLDNAIGSRHLYRCDGSHYLGNMLNAGKPIIRSDAFPAGSILHNNDIDSRYYDKSYKPSMFVQHRLNLHPEKRIQANLIKMAAEGLTGPDWSVDRVLAHDFSSIQDPGVHRYLGDIRRLQGTHEPAKLTAGFMDMRLGHPIEFFSDTERDAFREFRSSQDINFVEQYLGSNLSACTGERSEVSAAETPVPNQPTLEASMSDRTSSELRANGQRGIPDLLSTDRAHVADESRPRLPMVLPDPTDEVEALRARLAVAEHREGAVRRVLHALIASLRPFGFDKKRFKRCVLEEGTDTPNEGPASAHHAVLDREIRRVLRETRRAPFLAKMGRRA